MAQVIGADHPGVSERAPAARRASVAGAGSAFAAVLGPLPGIGSESEGDSSEPAAEADDQARDAAGAGPPTATPPVAERGPADAGHGAPEDGHDGAEAASAQRKRDGGRPAAGDAGAGVTAGAEGEGSRPPAIGAVPGEAPQPGPGHRGGDQPQMGIDRARAPAPPGIDGARGPAPAAAQPLHGQMAVAVARPRANAVPPVPGDHAPAAPPAESALTTRSRTTPSARKAGSPPLLRPLPMARQIVPNDLAPRLPATAAGGAAADGTVDWLIVGTTAQAAAPASPPAMPPAAPPPPLPPAAIIAQIAQAANTPAPATIEITLQPQELGRLRLLLRPEEGSREIRISLAAERAETLDLLRRHAGMLEGAMRDLGFARPRLDFTALTTGDATGAGAGADHAGGRGGDASGGRAGHRSVSPAADQPSVPEMERAAPRRGRGLERLDIRL